MRRLAAIPFLLAFPGAAYACAACAAGVDRTRAVFYSTIALSLLPLILLGSGALWLRARARARSRALHAGPEPAAVSGQTSAPSIAVVPAAGPRLSAGGLSAEPGTRNGCAPAGEPAGATW